MVSSVIVVIFSIIIHYLCFLHITLMFDILLNIKFSGGERSEAVEFKHELLEGRATEAGANKSVTVANFPSKYIF